MPCATPRLLLAALLLLPGLAAADNTKTNKDLTKQRPTPRSAPVAPGATAAPAAALPLEVPAASGNEPLQNPAPAAPSAPADSDATTAPTAARTVQVIPAASAGEEPELVSAQRVQRGCSLADYGAPFERGQTASSIYNTCSGFSLHKPTFLTFAYSNETPGNDVELMFQFSGKVQVYDFGKVLLYGAYTQKSYLQVFNSARSKSIRENLYNPEGILRFPKLIDSLPGFMVDLGLEHESNGEDLPDSRSWNRLYIKPVFVRGREAYALKLWYRLPEDDDKPEDDPERDDNPDIEQYYGIAEFRYRRDFDRNNTLLDVMTRFQPETGRGAIQVDLSSDIGPVGGVFVRLFNGYGDSLIEYDKAVTRLAVGVALQR